MGYKADEHKKIEEWLQRETADVPDFIRDYLLTLKSSRTKTTNWRVVRDLFDFLLTAHIIKKDSLKDITKNDVRGLAFTHIIRYLDQQMMNGNSLSTVNTKKAILGGFWTYLVNTEVVNRNIVHSIPKSKYKEESTRKAVEIPTDDQLQMFIRNLEVGNGSEFDIARNLTIVNLFIGSGIRCEELIGLDMADLFLDDEKPYIMVMGKGKRYVKDRVYITDEAADYLDEYLTYRRYFMEDKRKLGIDVDETPVFLANTGRRVSKRAIDSFFNRYSEGQIYPHMLRHLCGTKIFEKTNDILAVQTQLRHKSVETAAKYYIHVSDDYIANVMREL